MERFLLFLEYGTNLIKNYYLFSLSFLLISFYGGLVCPFIDGLGYTPFGIQIAILYLIFFGLRWILRGLPNWNKPEELFLLDIYLFLGIGFSITIFNIIFYQFPFGSGLKVSTVILFLGFFNGLDSYLRMEYKILLKKENPQKGSNSSLQKLEVSTIKRFALVSGISLLACGITIVLVIAKDIPWILSQNVMYQKEATRKVLLDISFVTLCIVFYIMYLIYIYSKNLELKLKYQKIALATVSEGNNFEIYVPVHNYDEFGQIAIYTNDMILSLKEKKRIESLLGKIIDPTVAKRLISENRSILDGNDINLTIMMTDIRGFTTFSELSNPKDLVSFLNQYFSSMIQIIRDNGGIVDKFIGDGILAIFGLDSNSNGKREAVQTALMMLQSLKGKRFPNGDDFQIGVGIHHGHVIAGCIGAEERLEYTVIGDTVNTTSRLESVTKDLNSNLVISRSVYEDLEPDVKSLPWSRKNDFKLKGKENTEEIYFL